MRARLGATGWTVGTDAGEERFGAGRDCDRPLSLAGNSGLAGSRVSFSGAGGVSHAFSYKRPENYRDLRVLVAGCSISSLEIARRPCHARSCARRGDYSKAALRPAETHGGNVPGPSGLYPLGALAAETFPIAAVGAALKQFALAAGGSPDQFGAPEPI